MKYNGSKLSDSKKGTSTYVQLAKQVSIWIPLRILYSINSPIYLYTACGKHEIVLCVTVDHNRTRMKRKIKAVLTITIIKDERKGHKIVAPHT